MAGRITRIAAVTFLSLQVAAAAWAQDDSAQGTRRLPLGERLQKFRNDIFGQEKSRPSTSANDIPRASRKSMPQQQYSPATSGGQQYEGVVSEQEAVEGNQPETFVAQPRIQPGPPPITENPYVKVPPHLQKQGARPARGGMRNGATVDPSAQGSPMMMGRMRSRGNQPPVEVINSPTEADAAEFENSQAGSPDSLEGAPTEIETGSADGIGPTEDRGPTEAFTPGSTEAITPADQGAPEYDSESSAGPSLADPADDPHRNDEIPWDAGNEPQHESEATTPEHGQTQDHPSAHGETEPLEPQPARLEPQAAPSEVGEPSEAENSDADHSNADDANAEAHGDEHRSIGRPTEASRPAGESTSSAAGSQDVLFSSKSPVLAVEASGPRKVTIGKEADFVVKVRNSGAAAKNVVVSVRIPATADVASAQPSTGAADPAAASRRDGALEWTIDHLAAGNEETLLLKLIPRDSAPLDLAAQCTFAPEPTQTMVQVQEPKLEMTLTGPSEVLFGETKVYKLTLSNPGSGDTENVSVGLLPIGRAGDAPASHKLGTLKAGESKTIDIELTARQAGAISIKAQAFADAGLRAEAAEQVLVRRGSLQVEVEAPRVKYAGTPGSYKVKVTNVGNALAENVHVAAVLPGESKFVSASTGGVHEKQQGRVVWKVGPLQAGGQRVFELNCALNTPGDNPLQFTAEANGDLRAAANATTRVEAIADLKLEVKDPQGPIAVGDEAVYEVRVRNRGTKAAEQVELVVFFSEGLEASSADGGPHNIGAGQVVFRPLAAVGAGDEAVFHIRSRAEASGNHVFRAELTCNSLNVKLATEEATHFYGEPRRTTEDGASEPQPAAMPTSDTGTEAAPLEAEPAATAEPTPAADPYADQPAATDGQ